MCVCGGRGVKGSTTGIVVSTLKLETCCHMRNVMNTVMDRMPVSPSTSYVEALTSHVMVFGEVIKVK